MEDYYPIYINGKELDAREIEALADDIETYYDDSPLPEISGWGGRTIVH